ncbi:hypothetical protein BKA80DRAFT_346148 [Phyllosticta citrichinensis]
MASSSETNDPLISVHAASGNEYCVVSQRVLVARDETTRREAWYGRLGRSVGPRSRVFNRVVEGNERPEILEELPLTPYFESRVEKTGKDWHTKKLYPVVHDLYTTIFGKDPKPSNGPKPHQAGTPKETIVAENSKGRKRFGRSTVEGARGEKKPRMSKSKAQVVPQSLMHPWVGDIVKEQHDQRMALYHRTGSFSPIEVDIRKVKEQSNKRKVDIVEERDRCGLMRFT